MEIKHRYRNRIYFRQIVLLLTVFIIALYLPFSLLVYRSAERNILSSINHSNQKVLSQLEQNYSYFSTNINSICLGVFWRNDVQSILHEKAPNYSEVYLTLKDLSDTVLASNPTIHSIGIYNKFENKLYSVAATGQLNTRQFTDLVAQQASLPVLHPILNEVSVIFPNAELSQYVLSHFMYQYGDPATTGDSYLVVNQYADLAVTAIDSSYASDHGIPSTTYFLSNGHAIASSTLMPEQQATHRALIDNFQQRRGLLSPEGGFYEDRSASGRHLVSYAFAGKGDTALLILQDYNVVFADLLQLHNDFLMILLLLFAGSVALVFVFSRKLYTPISRMLDYFSKDATPQAIPQKRLNELELMQSIYESTNEQYRRLASKETLYAPMAAQYSLRSLLLKSSRQNIQQFQKMLPGHWLTDSNPLDLRIVMLQMDLSKAGEDSLLLYAVQNISEELLGALCRCISFHHEQDTLGVVLGTASSDVAPSEAQLAQVLGQVVQLVQQYFGVSVGVVITGRLSGISSLDQLYTQALHLLTYRFVLDIGIITPESCALHECNAQTSYSTHLDLQLEQAIHREDCAGVRIALAEIKTVISTLSSSNALICTVTLLNQLNRFLVNHVHSSGIAFNTLYRRIIESRSIDQCFEELLRYVEGSFSHVDATQLGSDELFTTTILEFVQKNYFDPGLSSQLIADTIGMSNRYIMKKFKNLTGITLTDYIVTFRMKKAASLLQNTRDSISSIAEQIGMDNESYFYKLFKKVYGCTPREFADVSREG